VIAVGSLFAGIGGIELGLERTGGFRTVWQVEIDDYARRVLEKHWPDVRRWRDVRTFPPEPVDEWRCDLICGGFPCQDISDAGKRIGIGGARSGLWVEFARIVRLLRPRFVLVENTPALLARGMGVVLGDMAAIGYDAEWQVLSASQFGAHHIRSRLFILAYPAGQRTEEDETEAGIIAGRIPEKRRQALPPFDGRTGCSGRHLPYADLCRVAYGDATELDRMRIGRLGNAVVPQVAEWIGHQILAAEQTPCD
jgi:DNA (cytosine-5)-methyltransferase 1